MRRKIAVGIAEFGQVRVQQLKVQGFLTRNLQPVEVKGFGHAVKTPQHIKRQVDGVALDVGQRMQQAGPTFWRADGAALRG